MNTLTESLRPWARRTRAAKKEKAAIALLTYYTTTCTPWNGPEFDFDSSKLESPKSEEQPVPRRGACRS